MKTFENKIEKPKFEENPFEDKVVAQEWINSVENDKGATRDREIYPRLGAWLQKIGAKKVVEIGAGQGICSSKLGEFSGKYIGVEPSEYLVQRAIELYKQDNRDFTLGNAYELPLPNESCDASFAINVWFHLENLNQAAKELYRILEKDGHFMIITVNPAEYDEWLSYYEESAEDDKKVIGKAHVPINPLSRNIFYKHSMDDLTGSLTQNGLEIDSIENFGLGNETRKVFLIIKGHKI